MKITLNLSNIEEAIRQVEEFREEITRKERLFLRELAKIGVDEADIRFKTAEYDGTNDVSVEKPTWSGENTIVVKASGRSILFIEFGTGVHYAEPKHELADKFGYERGGYGKGQGKKDFWYYKGESGTNGETPKNEELAKKGYIFTHGNIANRCMWETAKKMRSEIQNIAKEVFGK